MHKLYSKALKLENIQKATKEVLNHEGSRTAGPDGINRYNMDKNRVIKEVKLRLRRYKKVNSRTVDIPKKSGGKRKLTLLNLYDRIAQQCVYRLIAPIVEKRMSEHSYGFRRGISAKVPVSKIATSIRERRNSYTVEIDFEKCFDNIPLDSALTKLRELGVKDAELIKTIKHLMYISKEYSGIGLGQGSILGPLLCNCYLDTLDRFMENEFDLEGEECTRGTGKYQKGLPRSVKYKGKLIEWIKGRGKKVSCRYYRYADDTIVICSCREAQLYVWDRIQEFIKNEMEICVNQEKSLMNHNRTKFLGFKIRKTDKSLKRVWIEINNEEKRLEEVKEVKLKQWYDLLTFKKRLIGILNYFDIVNNMRNFLSEVYKWVFYQGRRYKKLKRLPDNSFINPENHYHIDIWGYRRKIKRSIKDYLIGSAWIKEREFLNEPNEQENRLWLHLKWVLYTDQRGKDKITKEFMKADNCVCHHIIPRAKGGTDEISNLILVTRETHNKLHYSTEELPKEFERYRKHLL